MEVQDMTQMANFVYSYYMEKVKVMKDYYQVSSFIYYSQAHTETSISDAK